MPSTVAQRQHTTVQTRSIDPKKLTVDIVASTPSIDSYGTIIDQNGWDLEQFKRNPVITWAHDDRGFTGSDGLPIANALPDTVRVEGGQLKMRLRFTPEDVNPFGYKVFRMIAEGFLHGLSVGFDPQDDKMVTDNDGQQVRMYTRCKLLETAVVTIPSNDDALIQRQLKKLNRDNEAQLEKARTMAREVEEMALQKRDDGDADDSVSPDAMCNRSGCKGQDDAKACDMGEDCDCRCHGKVEKSAAVKVEKAASPIELEEFHEFRSDFTKYKSYFVRKQPANRASTKVLAKFYKEILQEEIPEDEVQAWEKMGDALGHSVRSDEPVVQPPVVEAPVPAAETPVPAPAVETAAPVVATPAEPVAEAPAAPVESVPEVKVETPVESTPVDLEAPQTGSVSTTVAVKPEETPLTQPIVPTAEEAPQRARKAFVQVPASQLPSFIRGIEKMFEEAGAEALRNGHSREQLGEIFAAKLQELTGASHSLS